MIIKKTPSTKRQIIVRTVGPSPLNLTPFDLPFEGLVSAVVALPIGTPPPDFCEYWPGIVNHRQEELMPPVDTNVRESNDSTRTFRTKSLAGVTGIVDWSI
jgi:hypothetical protein